MSKFTPGPWVVGGHSSCGRFVRDLKYGRIVAETHPDDNQCFDDDARLIAAAPEMYIILKQLEPWVGNIDDFCEIGDEIKEILRAVDKDENE